MAADAAYLRFPTIRRDRVAFVAEDDVWLAPASGGRAWRVTADSAPVAGTRLSPDGERVAFTSRREGPPEVYVADVDGGGPRRLTFWGVEATYVLGWLDDARVLAASATGQVTRHATWAWALPTDGGPAERLPLGPVSGYAPGPDGALVLATDGNRRSAAAWKRYRGGQAGKLWLGPEGERGRFDRFLAELDGQLQDPVWLADRVAFLSDHEGWGNVYSVAADGSDLRRHTDHADAYARALSGDGDQLVYQCLGELYLVDSLAAASEPRRLEITLGGPRTARRPAPVDARRSLGELAPDRTGRASAVEVHGSLHWLTHRDGPARALADTSGVRTRLPVVVPAVADPAEPAGATPGAGRQVVLSVTDADGDDALEVGPADGSAPRRRLAAGGLGRVLELVGSPDGRLAAVASHDGRVLLVDLTTGDLASGTPSTGPVDADPVTTVVEGLPTDASGLAFSPDSRWLAWSHPGPYPLRQIRLAELGPEGPRVVEATALRFVDTEPVFTLDGRYLAFLSVRTFDPVYDAHVFDMSFVAAQRPHLLPLEARTPSPFDPEVEGRPAGEPDGDAASGHAGATGSGSGVADSGGQGAGAASADGQDADEQSAGEQNADGQSAGQRHGAGESAAPPRVGVDEQGLTARAVPVPVPAGRYRRLQATKDGLAWLESPLAGELGEALGTPEEAPAASLRRYDLRKRRAETVSGEVRDAWVSGDGQRVVVRDADGLRVLPADRRAQDDDPDAVVEVDLGRLRVVVDPAVTWRQMYEEQGRLMRDHFWVPDMAGVDWEASLARYRPLLDRIGSRDDLSEVLWEVVGDLGSSHAYEIPPDRAVEAAWQLGYLGADLRRESDGSWRVGRVLPGEPSAVAARSPLLAPGAGVQAGDALLAVDGRPVDPVAGPWPLLVGTAGRPVELTVQTGPGDAAEPPRRVTVVPLADEGPLRYHEWVTGRREATHAATDGRVGYLHVPDMMAGGWAQLHRDLRTEVTRDALVLDLRANRGGHLSELVLERLARRIRARSVARHAPEEHWPSDAPRGPLVALADQWAGSDGDIGAAMFRALGLGPVVGTRTWGGVIGIDGRYELVDGTMVTQPRYGFWTVAEGWDIENYGVDPDVEVPVPPHAWGAGEDPQLDTAVRLALAALENFEPVPPPDPATRPDRSAPPLPPRPTSAPTRA